MNSTITRMGIEPKVRAALTGGKAVVALESTIITHGMPWPANFEMLQAVEADVAAAGAVPATIAVVDGVLKIGLETGEAEALAKSTGAAKLSRADLAHAMAFGLTGGTTVAATMMAAYMAGIRVFATGGIGGVHRGAETSFDISADLDELARTPVVVVSAGAKAILDIPKTLEALETRGVPVISVGQDAMPAFWSRDSGLKAPLRLDSAAEIARLAMAREDLSSMAHGGMLIANPVPGEAEIPFAEMASIIVSAQAEADRAGVSGKAVTPWLLSRIVEITGGRSLETNIALVRNNARLAGEIAVEMVRGQSAT